MTPFDVGSHCQECSVGRKQKVALDQKHPGIWIIFYIEKSYMIWLSFFFLFSMFGFIPLLILKWWIKKIFSVSAPDYFRFFSHSVLHNSVVNDNKIENSINKICYMWFIHTVMACTEWISLSSCSFCTSLTAPRKSKKFVRKP